MHRIGLSRTARFRVPLIVSSTAALLAALGACGPPAAPSVPAGESVAALDACRLPPDSIHTLVILDHSGSMAGQWDAVRQSLAGMVSDLPDGTTFQMERFSARVSGVVPETRLDGGTRAGIQSLVGTLPTPDASNPTDIGEALSRAANLVERQRGRGGMLLLFVVTDGEHAPPKSSRFAGDSAAAAFDNLAGRWRQLMGDGQTGTLITYTVPIGRGGSAGAGLVERIVPYTVAFPEQTPATLGREIRDRISAAVRDSRRIRAAAEVEDVRLTARLEQDPQPIRYRGATPVRAVLRSGARCVTYAIAPGGKDTAWIRIPPGGSAPHVIQARSRLGLLQALPWNGARTETLQATPDAVPVAADVAFEPADSLVALELNPASRRVRIAAAGTVEHRPMPWSEFLAGLATVGVLALLAWMGMRRPRVWGEVIIHPEKKRTELGEHATSRTLVTLPNGVRLEFVARKRNPLAKGYNSRVGVRATDGTPLRVQDREGPRAADPSGTVWLDDESTITATSADGNAASATWR